MENLNPLPEIGKKFRLNFPRFSAQRKKSAKSDPSESHVIFEPLAQTLPEWQTLPE